MTGIIQVFKVGKHTSANGITRDYTADELRQCAADYNEALHAAPFVVGHPKDTAPSYGWPDKFVFDESTGVLGVVPKQVDADFAEMVNAKRFPKVSMSFYLPESPANPKPGTLYPRHVGFLGAQPPAVKGLKEASFTEDEEGVVEHTDGWGFDSTAGVFRSLREWIISKFGLEAADTAIPSWQISVVQDACTDAVADAAVEAVAEGAPIPDATAFQEGATITVIDTAAGGTETTFVVEAGAVHKVADEAASFAERESAIEAAEAALQARERAVLAAEVASFCETLNMPAEQTARARALLMHAESTPEVEVSFAEGADPAPVATLLREFLQSIPPAVQFGEVAAPVEAPAAPQADVSVPAGFGAAPEAMQLLGAAQAYQRANPGVSLSAAALAVSQQA
jgi:hypothetical protein